MHLAAPAQPLTDGVVTLRLPSVDAGDIDAVAGYAGEGQLDGGWLPEIPLVTAGQLVADWLEAWAGRPSRNGPAFVVAVPPEPRFVGIVGVGEREEGAIEMIYGMAPRWRGQGMASRAARLAARSVASQPGVRSVEVRIGQDARASRHVAVNAGFVVAGTVPQFVPATGETFEDLRYLLPGITPGREPSAAR
ncbi:MAG TPA: GNAT family protein [Streptosporangiaceae bacterium]